MDPAPAASNSRLIFFAIAIAVLIGVALFSLSRLRSAPWTNPLKAVSLESTLRQDLPQIEDPDLSRAIRDMTAEGRWILLSFWTVTCGPCLEELPTLNALAASWQGPPFQVITVNTDRDTGDDLDLAKRFLQEEQIAVPTFYDVKHKTADAFQVQEYPRHFLISPEKIIVWAETGAFEWDRASARDQLLKRMEPKVQEPPADPQE